MSPSLPSLCANGGPFFSFSLSLSFDGDLEVDSFLGDDEPLGLFCCCWATIAKVCSSGVLLDGCHKPWLERLVYLLWTSLKRVSGRYPALLATIVTEVDNLQGMYPLKDEWVFGCSLKTRLADQTKTQQLKWLWSKDSMNSTINQRLVEQTQEMNCKLEGSGGSTLDDTLRKQYLSSSDE